MQTWLNGSFINSNEQHLHHQDAGLQLGDGIFETIKAHDVTPEYFEEHWKRFQTSADYFQIPIPFSKIDIQNSIKKLLKNLAADTASVKLLLTRGRKEKPGLYLESVSQPTFLIEAQVWSPPQNLQWKICRSTTQRSMSSKVTPHKTLNYLENLMALQEAQNQGYDEAIFCIENNWVQSGTRSNLFMIKDQTLYTPPLKTACLPGIMRQYLLSQYAKKTKVREELFTWTDLTQADEIFMSNSLLGKVSVSQIEKRKI